MEESVSLLLVPRPVSRPDYENLISKKFARVYTQFMRFRRENTMHKRGINTNTHTHKPAEQRWRKNGSPCSWLWLLGMAIPKWYCAYVFMCSDAGYMIHIRDDSLHNNIAEGKSETSQQRHATDRKKLSKRLPAQREGERETDQKSFDQWRERVVNTLSVCQMHV